MGGVRCCEWCDSSIDFLQEQILQLNKKFIERDEEWRKRFHLFEFQQKILREKVVENENVFVPQVQLAGNLAGLYDAVEGANGRVNRLRLDTQGAFTRFYELMVGKLQSPNLSTQFVPSPPPRC